MIRPRQLIAKLMPWRLRVAVARRLRLVGWRCEWAARLLDPVPSWFAWKPAKFIRNDNGRTVLGLISLKPDFWKD